MLRFLRAPAPRRVLEFAVAGEHAAEIVGVVGAVLLDDARRLDHAQELGIDLGAIEALPRNIVERPAAQPAPLGR